MGAKSPGGSKNYFGHCAGIICQGQLDFISGLLINNELVFPNAAIWDSQIFHKNRIIIYTDGNAYQTNIETNAVPPNAPWVVIAFAWVSGGTGYSTGDKVVSGGFVFQSSINGNTTTPPATTSSNADWKYLYTPTQWTSISTVRFWSAGSVVAWEGQVYQTAADTNNEPPNPPWVPFQILQSASPNPLKMTVPKSTRFGQNAGPGDWYLYWGTPNQLLDPSGEEVLTGLNHPPYRNCAVIVGKSILFGTQTVNPPSVQVLGGRAPVQSIITGPATALDLNWQANPWCVLAEMLTHPIYGLGLPTSWFDSQTWNAEANRCYANPSLFYISPMYTSLKKVSELAADLLGYADSFILWSTIATLMAGHWPHGEAPPAFGVGNTINRDNIIKEFSSSSEGWWGTANSVAVSIQDLQAGFKSRPCLAPNLFNMAVTRRVLTQKIERPFITRYSQGLAWATEFAKIAGDQTSNGTIEVQSEKINAIQPGSLFLLTDDQFGTSEVQRCTRKVISAPPTGTTKINHETERGVAPQPYSPTQTNPAPASGPAPSVINEYQLVQLPTSLAGKGGTVALLAGRPSSVTTALEVWFQQADQSAFQLLGTNGTFAVAGTIFSGSGGEIATIVTTNTQAGATYNFPPGSLAFGCLLTFYSPIGTLLGHFSYGTDYNFDLINNTVTLTAGTSVPNGSTMVFVGEQGTVATASATVGNTYNIPEDFWAQWNVWTLPAAITYTGGLMGTHCTEGTDYLIDPGSGTFTILAGGAIGNTDRVFIFFNQTLLVRFAADAPASDIEAITAPLTQDEVNDDTLLLFAFKASNPKQFEIMSLVSSSVGLSTFPVNSVGYYNFQVKRQQYGTLFGGNGVTDFGPGDLIFIIPRAGLNPLSHQSFEGLEESGGSANFILAPQSAWVDAAITDLYDVANNPTGLSVEFNYTFDNVFGPTVTWIQELQNGSTISSFSGTFSTGDVFYFAFQMNAGPGANIISASLTAGVGEQQMTLWSNVFTPSQQINASAQFSLPQTGTWNLALNVYCDDGSQTVAPLTLPGPPGTNPPVTMQVNAAGSPSPYSQSPPLSKSNYAVVGNYIKNLKFGPMTSVTGLAVQYQLQDRGVAYNSGAWLTAGSLGGGLYGPVPNFRTGLKTLYAKSSATGHFDSPVVSWNL